MVDSPNEVNNLEESKSMANNASYNLIFKIKREINNIKAKIRSWPRAGKEEV